MIEWLILVRHGETVDNVNGVAQGSSDSPLTERGLDQVRRLASRLRSHGPTSLWVSPLPRAVSTAEAIADQIDLQPRLLDDLREMHCGRWEGQSFLEVRATERNLYERWRADPMMACPGGGESFQDVVIRMKRAIDAIEREPSAGARPLVVSHGTAIRLATTALLGFPLESSRRLMQHNAAINILERRDRSYLLRVWNDATHCYGDE
jgi:broad specificity phosphatase PhoE